MDSREKLPAWRVVIEVYAEEGATAREAAEAAWDGIIHDLPPIVKVWALGTGTADATVIDLSEESDEDTDSPTG